MEQVAAARRSGSAPRAYSGVLEFGLPSKRSLPWRHWLSGGFSPRRSSLFYRLLPFRGVLEFLFPHCDDDRLTIRLWGYFLPGDCYPLSTNPEQTPHRHDNVYNLGVLGIEHQFLDRSQTFPFRVFHGRADEVTGVQRF